MNDRDFQMYLNFEQHRLADRFFKNLDPEVLQSLDAAQKKDLSRALVRSFLSPSLKSLDLRWSFPWFKKQLYLSLFLGPELRQGEPRYYNRYLSRSRWLTNTLFLMAALGILFCALIGLERVLARVFSG